MFKNFLTELSLLICFNVDLDTILSMLKTAYPTLSNKNYYFAVLPQEVAQIEENNILLSFNIKNSDKYVIACIKKTALTDEEIEIPLRITEYQKQWASFSFVRYESFIAKEPKLTKSKNELLLEAIKPNIATAFNQLTLEKKNCTNSFALIPQNLVACVNQQDRPLIKIIAIPETYFFVAFFTSKPGESYIVDGTGCMKMDIKKLLN